MLKKHLELLKYNLEKLKIIKNNLEYEYKLPLNDEAIKHLIENNFTLIDSLSYRFAKIQSLLGEKIFKEVLECLEEIVEDKNFLEILALLEKNGIIKIDEWRELRYIRNAINHEYPEEIEEIVITINTILDKIDYFENIYNKIKEIQC